MRECILVLLPILFSSWLLGLLLPVGSLVPGEDFQSVAFGAFNNSCFTNKPSVASTCTAVHQVENQMQFALRNGNIKRFSGHLSVLEFSVLQEHLQIEMSAVLGLKQGGWWETFLH